MLDFKDQVQRKERLHKFMDFLKEKWLLSPSLAVRRMLKPQEVDRVSHVTWRKFCWWTAYVSNYSSNSEENSGFLESTKFSSLKITN